MNILFFCRLFNPHIGGVEKHVAKISDILIENGHEITLVTEKYSLNLKNKERIRGVKVYRISGLKEGFLKKFRIWKWFWTNRNLIKNADVVHCHDVFFWYLPFRFIYPSKKIFITFHGYEKYPLKLRQILMHKISEALTMGNICIGDFISKWYGTKPTYVSYGAVDISKIKSKKEKNKNNSAVFIGRLDKQTEIGLYTKAYELIKEKIPDFKLTIIGDGFYRSEIQKDIKVLGFKSDPGEYLINSNMVFALGYLSILEAMAGRKLVFAIYNNPLKKDYLKMSPFLKYIVISSSIHDFATKVIFHIENPEVRNKMIEEGYLWAKKQTWSALANNYLKLWKN